MIFNDKSETWVTRKPSKNKKKYWVLESRWLSFSDYEKYTPKVFKNKEGFTTEWGNTYKFATKFFTPQGAKDHYAAAKKDDERDSWWAGTLGREWRIRNIVSHEIILIPF